MTTTKMTRSAHGLDSTGDHWAAGALCNLDTAHLFDVTATRIDNPYLTADNRAAIRLCRRCPVNKTACLDNALANHPNMWVIAAGQLVHDGRVIDIPPRQPASKPRNPDLPAQIAVLRQQGHTIEAIAVTLHVSIGTVRRYVRAGGQP